MGPGATALQRMPGRGQHECIRGRSVCRQLVPLSVAGSTHGVVVDAPRGENGGTEAEQSGAVGFVGKRAGGGQAK